MPEELENYLYNNKVGGTLEDDCLEMDLDNYFENFEEIEEKDKDDFRVKNNKEFFIFTRMDYLILNNMNFWKCFRDSFTGDKGLKEQGQGLRPGGVGDLLQTDKISFFCREAEEKCDEILCRHFVVNSWDSNRYDITHKLNSNNDRFIQNKKSQNR